jgi:hypothetical protein
VAYVRATRAPFDSRLYNEALVEQDLRTGAITFESGGDAFSGSAGGGNYILARVLKRNGSLAFYLVTGGRNLLRRVDRTGTRDVDSDASELGVDPYWLRLSSDRRTLRWRSACTGPRQPHTPDCPRVSESAPIR